MILARLQRFFSERIRQRPLCSLNVLFATVGTGEVVVMDIEVHAMITILTLRCLKNETIFLDRPLPSLSLSLLEEFLEPKDGKTRDFIKDTEGDKVTPCLQREQIGMIPFYIVTYVVSVQMTTN